MRYKHEDGQEVEAFQSFNDMGTYTAVLPRWALDACLNGTIFAKGADTYVRGAFGVETLVKDGDYIARHDGGSLSAHDLTKFREQFSEL